MSVLPTTIKNPTVLQLPVTPVLYVCLYNKVISCFLTSTVRSKQVMVLPLHVKWVCFWPKAGNVIQACTRMYASAFLPKQVGESRNNYVADAQFFWVFVSYKIFILHAGFLYWTVNLFCTFSHFACCTFFVMLSSSMTTSKVSELSKLFILIYITGVIAIFCCFNQVTMRLYHYLQSAC